MSGVNLLFFRIKNFCIRTVRRQEIVICGIAEKELPLAPGLELCGYIGRTHGAEGTRDPLKIKALYLENQTEKFLLISCDLLGMERDLTDKAAMAIEQKTGIPKEKIIICCTHTHSAPAAIYLAGCGEKNPDFLTVLHRTILDAAVRAVESRKPAELFFSVGKTEIAVNRVLSQMWGSDQTENWEVRNWDEEDCREELCNVSELRKTSLKEVDDELLVLQLMDGNERMGLVVNLACHPVTFEPNHYCYSADFFGEAEKKIQKKLGKNIPVLFLNGCCGDLNPRERGGEQGAVSIGHMLAKDVLQAIDMRQPVSENLKLSNLTVEVPLDIGFDRESLKRRISVYQDGIERETGLAGMIYSVYLNWGREMMRHLENGTLPRRITSSVTVAQLGSLTMVFVPFELFTEVGLLIKQLYGAGNTMVVAYANGEEGYFISETLYPYAKYERRESFKFTHNPGSPVAKAQTMLLEALRKGERG